MKFKGIVLTGTSAAGKSSIEKNLCMNNNIYCKVRSVTTRAQRADDKPGDYDYISKQQFNTLRNNNKLLIEAEYRDEKYGIRTEDFDSVTDGGKVPILVITPKSVEYIELNHIDISSSLMSFFIDAPDSLLNDRLNNRDGVGTAENVNVMKQRNEDRTYTKYCLYELKNYIIDKTTELIRSIWEQQNSGGVLSKRIIKLMIECGLLLEHADINKVKSASYDLSLGDEYYYRGKIHTLSNKEPFMEIEPYDYVIASCKETAYMPRDITGRFGVTVNLFCQGIIMSNGPQVDPGFIGKLFCLLFNTSNKTVVIKREDHYATLEFHKLLELTEPYAGKYQGKNSIVDYIPSNALYGGINELKKEIEQLKNGNKYTQNVFLGIISLILAVLSVILVFK